MRIERNLIHDVNTTSYPFYMATWAKDWVWATTGAGAILADPLFVDAAAQDFRPQPGSPAVGIGALEPGGTANVWWRQGFPPEIEP